MVVVGIDVLPVPDSEAVSMFTYIVVLIRPPGSVEICLSNFLLKLAQSVRRTSAECCDSRNALKPPSQLHASPWMPEPASVTITDRPRRVVFGVERPMAKAVDLGPPTGGKARADLRSRAR